MHANPQFQTMDPIVDGSIGTACDYFVVHLMYATI